VQNVKRAMEIRCGITFGGGLIPSLVVLPRSLLGLIVPTERGYTSEVSGSR
jgi:hypothetical protein